MEFVLALIIFMALIAAWVVLPSSKAAHNAAEHEPVTLPSAQQV